jgi:hypothetical protein
MAPEIRQEICQEIRQGRADDADFIARTVLLAQRGPVPRGWIDIALAQAEPQVLDFIRKLAVAKPRSWYHVSQFLVAEVEGRPAAALCAMPSRLTHDTCGRHLKKLHATPA